jgi:hypothetical protein
MRIPEGYAHVQHFFQGAALPNGAAVTYGCVVGLDSSPNVMAEALHGAFGTNLMPNLCNSVSLSTTRVKWGPNTTGPFDEYVGLVNGGVTGTAASPNVAFLIEKRTGLGGRMGQGRFYLPGVPESVIGIDGRLDTGVITAVNSDLNAFLSQLEAGTRNMVLLHNTSLVPTPVVSLNIDPIGATQRRRLR